MQTLLLGVPTLRHRRPQLLRDVQRRVPEQAAAADSSDEEQSQPGESDADVDEVREICFQNALDGCEGL